MESGTLVGGRLIEEREGQLEAINAAKIDEVRLKRRQVAMADTYEAMKEVGRQRGYKPNWARMAWNARMKKQGRLKEMIV